MVQISVIELATFNDIVYFLHSRLTTMNISGSLLCTENTCFTVVSGGNDQLFVIKAPAPSKLCRFAYVDETGSIKCSDTPPIGRPTVIIISVKNVKDVEHLAQALS